MQRILLLFTLFLTGMSLTAQPDLATQSVIIDEEDKVSKPGDRVRIEYVAFNAGNKEADDPLVGYYISTQPFGAPDIFLESETISDLDPGEVEPESEQFTLPGNLADGKYWIVVRIDPFNQIAESSESNNRSSAPITIGSGNSGGGGGGPTSSPYNLVNYTTFTPYQPNPAYVRLNIRITNQGTIRSPQSDYVVLLNGSPWARYTVPQLNVGQSVSGSVWAYRSGAINSIFTEVDRDNVLVETNESDNIATYTRGSGLKSVDQDIVRNSPIKNEPGQRTITLKIPGITTYPNPVAPGQDLTVVNALPNLESTGTLQLTDVSGRVLASQTYEAAPNRFFVPATVPAGFYLLQWQGTLGVQTTQVIVR